MEDYRSLRNQFALLIQDSCITLDELSNICTVCKIEVAEDRWLQIKDVYQLCEQLENQGSLGSSDLHFMKVAVVSCKKYEFLMQIEAFEAKQKGKYAEFTYGQFVRRFLLLQRLLF